MIEAGVAASNQYLFDSDLEFLPRPEFRIDLVRVVYVAMARIASSPSPPQTFVELWDQIGQELARCKAQGLPPPSLYQLEIALGLDPKLGP